MSGIYTLEPPRLGENLPGALSNEGLKRARVSLGRGQFIPKTSACQQKQKVTESSDRRAADRALNGSLTRKGLAEAVRERSASFRGDGRGCRRATGLGLAGVGYVDVAS
ncbi:hypothetical protein NDU88_001710 [Pleurodeles waltl]|uniref:Uncharacterized protein n=1 Tax=Pleurodeles waltl TaxID=8319 RepID=A0AAV7M8Y8_PLEWA|nr:hypothetical protein NDU88_001710 [Pleurodeles waltl]